MCVVCESVCVCEGEPNAAHRQGCVTEGERRGRERDREREGERCYCYGFHEANCVLSPQYR